ncbi:hypothetical protein T484DRAFT_1797081 [Baffinella frigidus]|nr:hypothetical protein T484DRAFT_1797081 [Cryptophyta sp. CCMP2293]
MYGHINNAVRQLVLDKFGKVAWEGILVEAAASKLGVGADVVLDMFGAFFLEYLKLHDMDRLLHIMGDNLRSFLYNLDYLHAHLADTFKGVEFDPSVGEIRDLKIDDLVLL